MAKTTPDMVIQLNVSAPGLEVAIKALTDAIVRNGAEVVIPEGSAVQIMGVDVVNAAQGQQPTATQPQATAAPVAQPQEAPKFSDQFMNIPDDPAAQPYVAPVPVPMAQPQAVAPTPAVQQQAAPAPVPMAQPQATAAPIAQPQAVAPAPTAQPQITLEAICNAGAKLVEKGQMNQVIALLGKYGVQAVNQIRPEQFAAFAADLRALGAQI